MKGERRLDPKIFANDSLNKLLRIFRHNFFSEDSTPLAKLAKWREVEMHGHLFKTEQSLGLLSSSSKEIVIYLQARNALYRPTRVFLLFYRPFSAHTYHSSLPRPPT